MYPVHWGPWKPRPQIIGVLNSINIKCNWILAISTRMSGKHLGLLGQHKTTQFHTTSTVHPYFLLIHLNMGCLNTTDCGLNNRNLPSDSSEAEILRWGSQQGPVQIGAFFLGADGQLCALCPCGCSWIGVWRGELSVPSSYCGKKNEVKVIQPCLTLWNPMDYTVHGIFQARILEWVAVPFSRGIFPTQ